MTKRVLVLLVEVAVGALIILSVWLVSAEHTRNAISARQNAQHYAASTGERVARSCRGRQGGAFTECMVEQIAATREDQRTQYDLHAQQDMALWALLLLAVSTGTLFVAAWALWYVKGTLDASRDAVREAQTTANAYIAVERPRLIPVVVQCSFDLVRKRLVVRIAAENVGKSAAYVHRFGYNVAISNGPPGPIRLKPKARSIYPEKTEFLGNVIADQDFVSVPYIVGMIIYRSPFEEEHTAYFCYRIKQDVPELGPTKYRAVSDKGADWPKDT